MAMVFFSHLSGAMLGGAVARIADAGAGGLSLFFLLSAYLIAELLRLEHDRTGTVHLKDFYIRRILRVWPLYFLMIGLNLVLAPLAHAYYLRPGALAAMLLMAANIYIGFAGVMQTFIFPLWSISLEEQFYLLVPTTWKWAGERGAALLGWATLPLAYLSLVWLGLRGAPDRQVFYASVVQFQYFGLGLVLSRTLRGRRVRLPGWARCVMIAAALGLMVWAAVGFHLRGVARPLSTPLGYAVLTAGTLLLMLAFLHWERLARATSLIFVGRISYGMLCFHILVGYGVLHFQHRLTDRLVTHPGLALAARWFCFGLAFLLTVGVAALSYRWFEMPFLRLKRRFTYVPSGQPLVTRGGAAEEAERAAVLPSGAGVS